MKMNTTMSPSQVKKGVKACLRAGLTANIGGSPGTGKSSLVFEIAKEAKLIPIDIRLSTFTPEDLNGFPMRVDDKVQFTPFDIFPLEGDNVPEGTNGWLIFLDELSSASKPVQAAAYRLILDREVGNKKLHSKVHLVSAGNLITDNAVVYPMSTALQSRLVHFNMGVSVPDWMEWAISKNFDTRILAFINYKNELLMDFKPDHDDNTFPCPRTWEFVNRLISKNVEPTEENLNIFAGTIGSGTAVTFTTFCKVYSNLPKISDIIANPITALYPDEVGTKYAVITMLMSKINDSNAEKILEYVSRFPSEMQIVFMRGAVKYNPEIRKVNKAFIDFIKKFSRETNSV